MKEYISKDDLSEKVQGRVIFTHEIDELPSITKADICREFWDKVIIQSRKTMHNVYICVDNVLAEMESEE